jgi:hypothetical protein
LFCQQIGKRLKGIRKDLDAAALEQGALPSKKVYDSAEALAQKKRRLNQMKKSSNASRRDDQEEDDGNGEEKDKEEEPEAEETDESGVSDDGHDNENSQHSESSSEGSDFSIQTEESGAKRKGRSSTKPQGAKKRKVVKQRFALLLAPRRGGTGLSRNAKKTMDTAKSSLKDLNELRSALVAVTSLWKQARSPSDKSTCEKQFLALGQSIYYCGVYSEKSGDGADATDLLNKLASLLRASKSGESSATFLEIDRLSSDLKGKTLHLVLFVELKTSRYAASGDVICVTTSKSQCHRQRRECQECRKAKGWRNKHPRIKVTSTRSQCHQQRGRA